MKKILMAILIAGAFPAVSLAGEAKVTWQEPEKFTDIRPGNELPGSFQERVIKEFDRMFADLAKELPDAYQWNVTVTDIDLAGEVRPQFRRTGNEVRVVKHLYWPRIAFDFDLKDPQRQTVASGKEDLNDMNFLMHVGLPTGHTGFPYEERMLRDWFHLQQQQKTFPAR